MLSEVQEKKLSELVEWDRFVDDSKGGTVFHKSWYLDIYHVEYVLIIFDDNKIVCGMPLYKSKQDCRVIAQSTKVVPYSGLFFLREYVEGSNYSSKKKERVLIELVCDYLKKNYSNMCFSLSTEITDIVVFLRQGFYPEVRYTIMCNATLNNDERRKLYDRSRRKYMKKTVEKGIEIKCDIAFDQIEFKKLTFWSEDGTKASVIYEKIVNRAYGNGCGTAIGAYLGSELVGMLILVWDKKRAYTILSFYDNQYASWGIGSSLHDAAISYVHEKLMINELDFEGSVLPGVEKFYLSFGGIQHIYFNMHWQKELNEELIKGLYVYE